MVLGKSYRRQTFYYDGTQIIMNEEHLQKSFLAKLWQDEVCYEHLITRMITRGPGAFSVHLTINIM